MIGNGITCTERAVSAAKASRANVCARSPNFIHTPDLCAQVEWHLIEFPKPANARIFASGQLTQTRLTDGWQFIDIEMEQVDMFVGLGIATNIVDIQIE